MFKLVVLNDDLFLGIVESIQSMQLLPRGLAGGGEKTAAPPETQDTPPPPPPKPPPATKPAVPPKPQVRIQTVSFTSCLQCDWVYKCRVRGCTSILHIYLCV